MLQTAPTWSDRRCHHELQHLSQTVAAVMPHLKKKAGRYGEGGSRLAKARAGQNNLRKLRCIHPTAPRPSAHSQEGTFARSKAMSPE